jgi:hypothetical protein
MMGQLMASKYAAPAMIGVVALCIYLLSKLRFVMDPNEPPLLHPRVPIIGHMIGMATGKSNYLKNLGLVPAYCVSLAPRPD